MKKKIVLGSVLIIFILLITTIPSTGAFTSKTIEQPEKSDGPGYLFAWGFFRGTISDLSWDGKYYTVIPDRIIVLGLMGIFPFRLVIIEDEFYIKASTYFGEINSEYMFGIHYFAFQAD